VGVLVGRGVIVLASVEVNVIVGVNVLVLVGVAVLVGVGVGVSGVDRWQAAVLNMTADIKKMIKFLRERWGLIIEDRSISCWTRDRGSAVPNN